MTITSLKSALQRITQLEQENEQLRAELEVYKNRNTGGRKKHDEAWMTSYRDFAVKYESGMTLMEIVAEGEISRRTAYRYKAYYDELQKNKGNMHEGGDKTQYFCCKRCRWKQNCCDK